MGSAPSSQVIRQASIGYKPLKKWMITEISLKIGFFDYGVCASPFEYQTQQKNGQKSAELVELQNIFKKQFQNELGVKYEPFDKEKQQKWRVGILNSFFKVGRYSPIYYDDVGIINNKFLMNKVQFSKRWIQAFDKAKDNFIPSKIEIESKIQIQKTNLLLMDWIHYRTLVVYAYRDEINERNEQKSFDEIIANSLATKYQICMREKFQSKIINQKYKIQKLLRRLARFEVDIFFLQDIDSRILKYIEKKTNNFRIARSAHSKSAILISEKGFRNIVGDSIRPLANYNRKYLDPEQKGYEMEKDIDMGRNFKQYDDESYHFQNTQHRNFTFAKAKIKKSTNPEKSPGKTGHMRKIESLNTDSPHIQQSHFKMHKAVSLNPYQMEKQNNGQYSQLFSQSYFEMKKKKRQEQQKMNPAKNATTQQIKQQKKQVQVQQQQYEPQQQMQQQQQSYLTLNVQETVQPSENEAENSETTKQEKKEQQVKFKYISKQIFNELIWNQNTLVQFLSNIILITCSFDEHEQNQQAQLKKMVDSLNKLHQYYPDHVIIAAIDIQTQINVDELKGFKIYPNLKQNNVATVFKRKTLMQPKLHKAGRLISGTQDYLISTHDLISPMVVDIDHNQVESQPYLIPSQMHPYDHFMISATVKCKVKKKVIVGKLQQ